MSLYSLSATAPLPDAMCEIDPREFREFTKPFGDDFLGALVEEDLKEKAEAALEPIMGTAEEIVGMPLKMYKLVFGKGNRITGRYSRDELRQHNCVAIHFDKLTQEFRNFVENIMYFSSDDIATFVQWYDTPTWKQDVAMRVMCFVRKWNKWECYAQRMFTENNKIPPDGMLCKATQLCQLAEALKDS